MLDISQTFHAEPQLENMDKTCSATKFCIGRVRNKEPFFNL